MSHTLEVFLNGMTTSQILLFVGTLLVAFQIAGDIGYAATLIAMPFALPLVPLMKKLGIGYKRVSPTQLGFQIGEQTTGVTRNRFVRAIWWILLIPAIVIFTIIWLVTQPIMLAYFFIGRPLIAVNRILNGIYRASITPWDIFYLTGMQISIKWMQKRGVKTTKRQYSDHQLLKIRRKKGDLPFLAFFGLLCIAVGFILELVR